MKKSFNDRLDAIDWIANNVDNEGQFEVFREQLNFNFIYTNELFITLDSAEKDVIILDERKNG